MGQVSKRNITMALFSTAFLMLSYQNCSKLNVENALGGSEKGISDQVGHVEIPESEETGVELPGSPVSQSETPVAGEPRKEVTQPYYQPEDEAVDYDANNRFTTIHEDSFLLVCGKQINSITSIEKTAKVVLVNSNLSKITGVKGELILVNSRSAKPTGGQENIRTVTYADEVALWEARCQAYEVEAINPDDESFQMTRVNADDVDDIPRSAPSYRFTTIQGVALVNLHTKFFKATTIQKGSMLKVKTDSFRFTDLSSGTVMELY